LDAIQRTKNAKQVYLKDAKEFFEPNSSTLSYKPAINSFGESYFSVDQQKAASLTSRPFA